SRWRRGLPPGSVGFLVLRTHAGRPRHAFMFAEQQHTRIGSRRLPLAAARCRLGRMCSYRVLARVCVVFCGCARAAGIATDFGVEKEIEVAGMSESDIDVA